MCMLLSQASDKITMIIDKMDSAKNTVPHMARFPKNIDEKIRKNLPVFHIVGVIIHGTPDRRYFFAGE